MANGDRLRLVIFSSAMIFLTSCAELARPEKILNKIQQFRLPSVAELTSRTPITTTFDDALTEIPLLDDYNPLFYVPLSQTLRVREGTYALYPGAYSMQARSYCLRAGTYGPGGGAGYLPAPLKGPKAKVVKAILARAKDHPEMPQSRIQLLLWAIISRLKLSEMSPDLQATARVLLTDKERFDLDGGWLGLIPDDAWRQLERELPSELLEVYRAEQKLRQKLASSLQSFEEVERYAVLAGIAPLSDELRKIPRGRWAYRKGGFFIRYFPSTYSLTKVEVFVPRPVSIKKDQAGVLREVSAPGLGMVELVHSGMAAMPSELRLHGALGARLTSGKGEPKLTVSTVSFAGAGKREVTAKVEQFLSTAAVGQMLLSLGAPPSGDGVQRLTYLTRLRLGLKEAGAGKPSERSAINNILLQAQAFEICVQAGDCDELVTAPAADVLAAASTLEGAMEKARDFDLPAALAMPASRSGQRLGISDQPVAEEAVDCRPLETESMETFCGRHDIYDRWTQIFRGFGDLVGPLAFFKFARDTVGRYCRLAIWPDREVYKEVNGLSKAVFEANLQRCNQLVQERPLDDSLEWALRYVEFEQCVVERYLTQLRKRNRSLYARVIKHQNLSFNWTPDVILGTPMGWADDALGSQFDLAKYSHRITVGYAGVYYKLGKTREEFYDFIAASPPPSSCPTER